MSITIKELKKHFEVFKRGDEFRISSLTEHGRFPYKYLCSAKKKGNSFYVLGYKPTTNIDTFKSQVSAYLSELQYDSEYYNPDYREGVKEVLYVHDYMRSLGFKNVRDETYVYNKKDIYGGITTQIHIWFTGLENTFGFKMSDVVSINLSNGGYSWTSIKVSRTFDDLKGGIDSMLKPLLVTESVKNLETSEKMIMKDLDLIKIQLNNLTVFSGNYKAELKRQLLEMAETIKLD